MYIGLRVKYPLFFSDFNKNIIFSADFHKYSNIKFHRNPLSGSRVAGGRADGRTDGRTDGRINMTKLLVSLRNFANAPKN